MRNTHWIGWPTASSAFQPVSDSATGLTKVIRPAASVAITASPMLVSVTRSHSRCWRSCRSAWCRYSAISIWVASSRSSNGLRMYPNGPVSLARASVAGSLWAVR